jgi:hypothetical protein
MGGPEQQASEGSTLSNGLETLDRQDTALSTTLERTDTVKTLGFLKLRGLNDNLPQWAHYRL